MSAETYICSKCKIEKPISEYYRYSKCVRGHRDKCIDCYKSHYKENKEKILEAQRNRADLARIKRRIRYENNKKEINSKVVEYHRIRTQIDPLFKLKHSIRVVVSQSFKKYGYTKKSKTHKIIGCDFNDFKVHLESKFEDWMNWDNYGKYNGEFNYGWDIDHIIPISSATSEDDVVRLNHYMNLQPLCSKINRDIKNDIVNYKAV